MDKVDKVDKLAEALGVKRAMAYQYLRGRGMPAKRASLADNVLGGGVMLWIEDGGVFRKVELYNKAEL